MNTNISNRRIIYTPALASGGGGPAPATTFDPAHNANAALSNGNLTAVHTGGGNSDLNAFSIASNTSNQKVYFEMTVVQLTFSGVVGISLDNSSANRFDGANVSPTKGALYQSNGAYICTDSVDNATELSAFAAGDAIDVAFRSDVNKIWFRKNNGAWNAPVGGTQDPATNQGGFAVTNTPSTGPWFALIGQDAVDGDGFTARFASTAWLNAVPSGFTQINA